MNSWCSFDSQHGLSGRHPANLGDTDFRYTNNDHSNNLIDSHQNKNLLDKATKMFINFILRAILHKEKNDCKIFGPNTLYLIQQTQMCTPIRMILKKRSISVLDIQEICGHRNDEKYEQEPVTRNDMINAEMQEPNSNVIYWKQNSTLTQHYFIYSTLWC